MSVSRSDTERRYSLGNPGTQTELHTDPERWSGRRTLLFIVGVSSFLWVGIIYAATLIF
jgi:hypothetical protein